MGRNWFPNASHVAYNLYLAGMDPHIEQQNMALRFSLIFDVLRLESGPGSSVGIATGYGLDIPGIESR